MPKHAYTTGQSVLLHFTRMTDGSTYLLLQRDGRSSGKCYHVNPEQAERLPQHITLQTEIFSVHPAVCYVRLPEGAIHHRHLAFTPEELAACDRTTPTPPSPKQPQQLTFNL